MRRKPHRQPARGARGGCAARCALLLAAVVSTALVLAGPAARATHASAPPSFDAASAVEAWPAARRATNASSVGASVAPPSARGADARASTAPASAPGADAPRPTPRAPLWAPTPSCTAPPLAALDARAWGALRRRGLAALRAGKRVPVVYLHVFKAGGTAVCDVAKAVGQRTPRASSAAGVCARCNANCNMPARFFRGPNATEQARALRQKGYEFVGNEFDGLAADPSKLLSPACAVWAVSLRDPVERFLSHFAALQRAYARVYGKFNAALGRDKVGQGGAAQGLDMHVWRAALRSERDQSDRAFADADLAALHRVRVRARAGVASRATARELPLDQVTASEFAHFVSRDADGAAAARRAPALRHWVGGDFFVRHLAGGFGDARDEDTADALLARAKARLATLFSVVIITDDLGSGEGDGARGDDPWQVLRAPLGWDRHATVLERTPTRANAAPRAASSRSKEMLANLAAINAPDLELFAFARELAANRTREFAADEARRRADPAAAERAVALKPPPPARPKVRQRWLAPH